VLSDGGSTPPTSTIYRSKAVQGRPESHRVPAFFLCNAVQGDALGRGRLENPWLLRSSQGLLQVRDDVVNVLDADTQSNHVRRDSGGLQFLC